MAVPKDLVQTETRGIDLVDAVVQSVQQLAAQIDIADELASRAGAALGSRIQRHLTGESVVSAAMASIAAATPASIDMALPIDFVDALEIKAIEAEDLSTAAFQSFSAAVEQTRAALPSGDCGQRMIGGGADGDDE